MKYIKFSHVYIKPIVRKRKYIAEFTVDYGVMKNVETTVGGKSPEECISKTEKFLGINLEENQYTIIA